MVASNDYNFLFLFRGLCPHKPRYRQKVNEKENAVWIIIYVFGL